jgi:16S rRNA processing protein RimM
MDKQGNGMTELTTPRPDELLLIGTVVNVVGLRGDVRVHLVSTQPTHLSASKPMLYTADGKRSFRLRKLMHYKNDLYTAQLGGIATRELADALRTTELYIKTTDVAPLDTDEYFLHDLPGMTVQTVDGVVIGTISDVISTGASDVVVVQREGLSDVLIPLVKAFVQSYDAAARTMVVTPIPGMILDE